MTGPASLLAASCSALSVFQNTNNEQLATVTVDKNPIRVVLKTVYGEYFLNWVTFDEFVRSSLFQNMVKDSHGSSILYGGT